MTDKFSKEKRSEIMSHIRAKDTKPEVALRSALHRMGYRFRKNDKRYSGTPDIYLPKYHTAIFVNGCFWHGHENCKHYKVPKSNTEFWLDKVEKNRERDLRKTSDLESEGITVIIVWECEISNDIHSLITEKIIPILEKNRPNK